jgi:hypothetical protein
MHVVLFARAAVLVPELPGLPVFGPALGHGVAASRFRAGDENKFPDGLMTNPRYGYRADAADSRARTLLTFGAYEAPSIPPADHRTGLRSERT